MSIEESFANYRGRYLLDGLSSGLEQDQRQAYFSGFHDCLHVIETIADDSQYSVDETSTLIETLHAEFQQFAAQRVGRLTN